MHLGFGWHGIGYHRVIDRDGRVENARPDYWQGAHVYGHNEISLGVCLIGRHHFTGAQFDALEGVLRQWQSRHRSDSARVNACHDSLNDGVCRRLLWSPIELG